MSEGSWRSPSAASARGTGRRPLDSVLPHPGKPRTVWVRLGPGNRPPAPTPRVAPALSRPHLSGASGAAVLTSPAGSRGAPDAMAADRRGPGPGCQKPSRLRAGQAQSAPPHRFSAFRVDARKCVTETRPGPPCSGAEVGVAVAVAAQEQGLRGGGRKGDLLGR